MTTLVIAVPYDLFRTSFARERFGTSGVHRAWRRPGDARNDDSFRSSRRGSVHKLVVLLVRGGAPDRGAGNCAYISELPVHKLVVLLVRREARLPSPSSVNVSGAASGRGRR
jgi:hypothetical protein